MKKMICLLLLLATVAAQAQKDSLAGIWYGKDVYASRAVHWSKKKTEGSRSVLRLGADGRYEYRGLNYTDTIRNIGTWERRGDTLVFHLEESNSAQYRRYPVASYLIYGLTKEALIYSNLITGREYQPAATMPEDGGDNIFTKVEIEPVYGGGNRVLYRAIYRRLLSVFPPNETPVTYTCRLLVRKDGSVNWNDVQVSDPRLGTEILNALKALGGAFLPGLQNGRNVNAYLTLSIDF